MDTPGFDDTARDDADVLYELAAWLKGLLQNEKKLAGLIYLHRITDNRLGSSAVRNLRMMRELVGDNNMKNVVLVTTRWENLAVSIVNTLLTRMAYINCSRKKPVKKFFKMTCSVLDLRRDSGMTWSLREHRMQCMMDQNSPLKRLSGL